MIENAKVEEIRKWKMEDGWYLSPTSDYVTLGYGVTLGDYVTLGYGVTLGYYVTLGDSVKLGDRVKLGYGVTLGDSVTGEGLNDMLREIYKAMGEYHVFTKWVTKERMSPNFDGGTLIEYKQGATVEEPEAVINDQQCAVGLHVLRYGYRPEWAGLCEANHSYIPLRVKVRADDICFAGLPTMDIKLRVRKLEVLD